MDIPFYSDIYAFPGPDWCHKHFHKPHFKQTLVIETSKEVIINDMTGFTRYTVKLASATLEGGLLGFLVQVVHHYPADLSSSNDLMLVIPEDGWCDDYKKMLEVFDTCVLRYNSLVKAETKDFRDIDIYKDKIGYEYTLPECCAFCKWCRRSRECGMNNLPWMLECHNPDNLKQFNYMVDPGFPDKHAHRYCSGWQKLPWMKSNPFSLIPLREDDVLNPIFPRVEPFGKCKGFKRAEWPSKHVEGFSEYGN